MSDTLRAASGGAVARETHVGFADAETMTCEAVPVGPPARGALLLASDPGDGVDAPEPFSPFAEASAGASGLRAGAGLLRGTDPDSGVSAQLIAGSVTSDARSSEVQVGLARLGLGPADRSNLRAQAFTASAAVGTHNADGSVGYGVGMEATVVGVEGTLASSGWSATGGIAAGFAAASSIGTRDADRDGSPELCGRVSFAFVTAGLCLERPW